VSLAAVDSVRQTSGRFRGGDRNDLFATVTIRHRRYASGWFLKVYRYSTELPDSVPDRLHQWSQYSAQLPSVPFLQWKRNKREIIARQRLVTRAALGLNIAACLLQLARDLDVVHQSGLVHGDVNRKNILPTSSGFQIVDIEPVLAIRTTEGTVLRTTLPFHAKQDRIIGELSKWSDLLGFGCFAAWQLSRCSTPAMAARGIQSLLASHPTATQLVNVLLLRQPLEGLTISNPH